jgi:carboxyl-terminal processing protease
MERIKRWLFTSRTAGLVLLALVLGLASGILVEQLFSDADSAVDVPAGARPEFELMAEVWRIIERKYVNQEGVEPRRMAYSAISGMVQTLGDAGHTRFLTPQMARLHASQIQGRFEGIGAYVEMKDGRLVIVSPIDDTPAQQAGLEAGDVILEVDGTDVTQLPLDEAVSRVLGPAGTPVTLTILDAESDRIREVTVERAEIELDLVTWLRLPGTTLAYVRISAFSEGATEDLEKALEEIQAEEITGLIVDLRNNPGGLLSEAVGVTSRLLEDGDVLLRRDSQGEIEAQSVDRGVRAVEMPLVVLTNSGTASAAEVVTGALQGNDRATVVGTTTSGAGTVLNEFTLSDGSVLLLAVEEWLTPDGRVIWQKGLVPDVEVALPEDAEPLLHLRQQLKQQAFTEEDLRNSSDVQLLRALGLLQGSEIR